MKAKLTIPCSKSQLKTVRSFVRDKIAHLPITDLEKYRITLAVDEAASNAIIHGNKCDETKTLKLNIEVNDAYLRVKIYDIGNKGFNPLLHYQKDMNEIITKKQKGGMGLKLIHDIMDEVNYYTHDDQQVCTLTKHLSL